jgi:hypothetical protein
VTKLTEVTLVGCWWAALYPLCRLADGDATWNRQLVTALLPMSCWLVLVSKPLPGWWVRRDGTWHILAARFWPVVASASSVAYPAVLSKSYELASVPAIAVYALGLLALLTLTPLALRLRGVEGAAGEPAAASAGEKMLAIGGLCCAFSLLDLGAVGAGVGLMPPWLVAVLRDLLRWAGVIGLSLFLVVRAERFPRRSFALYRWYRRLDARVVLVVGCVSGAVLSGLFAYFVLGHMAHIQDEIAMIFQAKNFADGRLYAPAPALPEFFDMEFVITDQGRWYGKYQFGPSLWYLPGVLLGCPWLVSPLLSTLAVLVLYKLAGEILGRRWSKGVVLLAVISPWWVMTFGSMMAHPGCLLILSAFGLFFVRAARAPGRWGQAFWSGTMLGLAINFRPYTALLISAAAIVAALAAGWWRNIRVKNTIAFAAPLAALMGLMLAYNFALTGDPLVTPFAKWSAHDRLGFGPDRGLYEARDLGFTPADGLANVRLQLQALSESAMGWLPPTLLLVLLPLASSRFRRRCGLLLLAPVALTVGYFFYFYGWPVYYGVRYWSESLAAYLMLMLVGLEVLRRWVRGGLVFAGVRSPSARSRAFVVCMLALLIAGNVCGFAPGTVRDYAGGVWFGSCRATQDLLGEDRLHNALVFMESGYYRAGTFSVDWYGAGFQFISPSLDDDVLFVRDLGDEKNRLVAAKYPQRRYFKMKRYGPRSADLQPYELR